MQQVTPVELKQWNISGREYILVDIREQWEHERFNIGGAHIPMGDLIGRLGEIPKDQDVVLYCEKGIRSTITIQRLEGYGYNNLFNLSGGMKAWREAGL